MVDVEFGDEMVVMLVVNNLNYEQLEESYCVREMDMSVFNYSNDLCMNYIFMDLEFFLIFYGLGMLLESL